jgi:putative CocE/NonD family hydrolase
MTVKSDFPCPIRQIDHVWIPLSDGVRLSARIWLPLDAEANPVPAILEYIPYRKNDFTALRDSLRHPYFAGHGYASIRVDMRGSGDSGGILYDEYLPQEQDDALEVLRWIAAQPWSTGAVGIIGKSWGGFNGLQIAARRPPELKAVISLCSTDDRYADDVHYMGGCLLASEMLSWASVMLAYNARPPDPSFAGDGWRDLWLERLEQTPPFIEAWLSHQRRDDFWKHGSVCENYAGITCPVYAVGGWADAYSNAIFRLLAGLSVPRKGLIGPWAHEYPEVAQPGPAIGFNQECLRWWDYWLKGIDTGIMNEPMLRLWLQDSLSPQTHYTERPGRWVAETAWPAPDLSQQTYWLVEGRLGQAAPPEKQLHIPSNQTHGLAAGVWCAYGRPGDLPADQQIDDGLALCFTSEPLDRPVEILGFPELSLTLASDRPQALIAVRLCDVAPGGASTLVTWGLLNLTHRDGHEQPVPLEPGHPYTVTLRLNGIAHVLPAGHHWRIALSPTYWPHAWPSPEPVTLTLFTGPASQLRLPLRPPQAHDADLPPFGPPEHAPLLAHELLRSSSRRRQVRRDLIDGTAELVDRIDDGHRRLSADGLEFSAASANTYTITEGDPLSAQVRCDHTIEIGRGGWQTRVETSSLMTADAAYFHVSNLLNAYEGQTRIFTKSWSFKAPRDHV